MRASYILALGALASTATAVEVERTSQLTGQAREDLSIEKLSEMFMEKHLSDLDRMNPRKRK